MAESRINVAASNDLEHPSADTPAPWVMWHDWKPDRLLAGYQARTLELIGVRRYAQEPDAPVTATLIRRQAPRHEKAVLYVHGWNDYFFQDHVAQYFDQIGFDFYALDLRRYGRSLSEGQLAGYVEDLAEYDLELDAAFEEVAAEHGNVTVMGHSTGGLITSLWAARRPGQLAGLILNSPWIDLQGSWLLRAIAPAVIRSLASRAATWAVPIPEGRTKAESETAYRESEWSWDRTLKKDLSQPIRPGWLRAVINGHNTIDEGLEIDCPILMLISSSSASFRASAEEQSRSDAVLSVERLAAQAHRLGSHLTLMKITDAVHDIALSAEPVRQQYFAEIERWTKTYLSEDESRWPGPGSNRRPFTFQANATTN